MKILMLLSNPFTNDPRVYNEAISLTKAGHSVTILCWDKKGSNPQTEFKNGIRVVRIANTPFMSSLPYEILRLKFWWREAYRAAMRLYEDEPFDIVHCHDLDTLETGVKLKRRLSVPLVYDAHEIWGYMLSRDLPNFVASHFLRKEKRLIKKADAVVTVNEPLKNYFAKLTEAPIVVVMNCKTPLTAEYSPPENDVFNIIYIGTLNNARFILEAVDVVSKMPDVRLTIAGIGKEQFVGVLKNRAEKSRNTVFLGEVGMDRVLPLTKGSDAVLCLTDPKDRNNSIATANKQMEAIATGRPIIVSRGTYPAEFTEKYGIGVVVEHSKEGLRDGIERLKNDRDLRERMGRKALEIGLKEYNWDNQADKLLNLYKRMGAVRK